MDETVRPSPSNINLPNLISVIRILLVPVFIYYLTVRRPRIAFTVFLIAALSDLLDGFAARLLNQKTRLGAILDPAGDKTLMTAAVILLSIPGCGSPNTLPLWLTLIVLGRDLILVSGALFLHRVIGRSAFPPILTGKACTVLQMTMIVLVLYFNTTGAQPVLLDWLFPLTAAVTLISGIQYGLVGLGWFRRRR